MKKITALVLVLMFAMQTFSGAFISFDYYINTKSFARNCVNKARPGLNCNGKCQMMKKLRQAEGNEKVPDKKFEQKNTDLSSGSFFSTVIRTAKSNPVIYFTINDCDTFDHTADIFRPPSTAISLS